MNDDSVVSDNVDCGYPSKISVIVPVFNTSAYLNECLDSIFNQTYKNLEVICIDDGSTDDSYAILKDYQNNHPNMIVIQQENRGAGAARNRGLEIATGEYYSFLDSDDFYDPSFLEIMSKSMEDNCSDVSICSSYYHYDNNTGNAIRKTNYASKGLIEKNGCVVSSDADIMNTFMGWAWDKLFRASFIDDLGLKFQEIMSNNDLFFVYSALIRASKISIVHKELCFHRINTNNSLQDRIFDSFENIFLSRERLFDYLVENDLYGSNKSSFLKNLGNRILYYSEKLKGTPDYSSFISFVNSQVIDRYDLLNEELMEVLGVSIHCYLCVLHNEVKYAYDVAVIIPFYNAANYLRKCVLSVLKQNIDRIQIICVDDGSTDNSKEIVQELMADHNNIVLLSQQNSGAGTARNLGMDYADAEYYVFLDADDYMEDDSLSRLVDFAKYANMDMIKTKSRAFDDSTGEYVQNDLYELTAIPEDSFNIVSDFHNSPWLFLSKVSVVPWNAIYRSSFIKLNNIRFNDLICVNDRSFYVAVISRSNCCMFSDIFLVQHRVNNSNSLVGSVRYEHFECEIKSFKIIKEDISKLRKTLKEKILNREMGDILHWQNKFANEGKDCTSINKQIVDLVESLDLTIFGDVSQSSWYVKYKKLAKNYLNNNQKVVSSDLLPDLLLDLSLLHAGFPIATDYDISRKYLSAVVKMGSPRIQSVIDLLMSSDDTRCRKLACCANDRIIGQSSSDGVNGGNLTENELSTLLSDLWEDRSEDSIAKMIFTCHQYDFPVAFLYLARAFRFGIGVEMNVDLSKDYYRKSNSIQEYCQYLQVLGGEDNLVECEEIIESASDKVGCLISLGQFFIDGEYKDIGKSIQYLERAVKLGSEVAVGKSIDLLIQQNDSELDKKAFEISAAIWPIPPSILGRRGRMYRDGRGVEKDLHEALRLMKFAANADFKWAINEYVDLLLLMGDEQSSIEAYEICLVNANKGDSLSQCKLARMYRDGCGVEKNLPKAAELMESALTSDCPMWARWELFDILWAIGTPESLEEAARLAEAGHAEGISQMTARLSRCYRDGKGVEVDLHKAAELMRIASESKSLRWTRWELFDILWAIGTLESLEEAARLAEAGHAEGISQMTARLARCYRDGRGVEADLHKAAELMRAASGSLRWARREYLDILMKIGTSESLEEMSRLEKAGWI